MPSHVLPRAKNSTESRQVVRRRHDRELRIAAIKILGGKCKRCGFDDERALQVDHINGGGSKELKLLGHTRRIYRQVVLGNDTKYQLLCANCNFIKMREEDGLYG